MKQRILSRHGHLSNDGAAQVLREMASQHLKHLFLGHLSSDCNRPELARNSSLAALESIHASHVTVEVASQDQATATLEL
ncbi:MAG: hypothetical protein R3F23_07535 [Verrucomicrobiia bacterium]